MASKDNFWRGVLQNAIGSLLAGLMLIGLGRAWFQHRFDSLIGVVKGGVTQISSLQAELNRLDQPKETQAVKKRRHHARKDADRG